MFHHFGELVQKKENKSLRNPIGIPWESGGNPRESRGRCLSPLPDEGEGALAMLRVAVMRPLLRDSVHDDVIQSEAECRRSAEWRPSPARL